MSFKVDVAIFLFHSFPYNSFRSGELNAASACVDNGGVLVKEEEISTVDTLRMYEEFFGVPGFRAGQEERWLEFHDAIVTGSAFILSEDLKYSRFAELKSSYDAANAYIMEEQQL